MQLLKEDVCLGDEVKFSTLRELMEIEEKIQNIYQTKWDYWRANQSA